MWRPIYVVWCNCSDRIRYRHCNNIYHSYQCHRGQNPCLLMGWKGFSHDSTWQCPQADVQGNPHPRQVQRLEVHTVWTTFSRPSGAEVMAHITGRKRLFSHFQPHSGVSSKLTRWHIIINFVWSCNIYKP